ncbi:MAG: YgdI/YgdR family lipoprotein [Betaproteobacteria bacterium]|jgi:uncharacterized protein YceK|nr:YgdI/YgdR family lipoprotein [Betaproteobacteria bacterium]
MKVGTIATWAAIATVVFIAGCASYYKVTDPSSGRTFYTEKVDRPKDQTTIMFKDAKTGAEVTLPSSEVLEISSDEYKKATGK